MVFSRVFSAALAVAILLAKDESVEATEVQLFSPSVRVNGMGQAGVALPDEPAGYYNPGAAALSSPTHTLQSRFYLSGLPVFEEDITYSYFAAQAATERAFDRLSWKGPTRLRAAFYGYRTELDFGQVFPNSVEVANNIGISLALRSVVEVGIGATAKWISSELGWSEGSAKTHDLGLMAVVPVVGVVERLTGWALASNHHLQPKFDFGLGVMWQNHGKAAVTHIARSQGLDSDFEESLERMVPYILPTIRRHGWSYSSGMDWHSDSFSLALGRVTFSQEISRRTDYDHITGLADRSSESDKSGVEVSILETVSIRRGEYEVVYPIKTSGWTVKSDGLFKIIAHFLDSKAPRSKRDALQFLARHLSISWSRFENNPAWLARSHSFIGLSF